jgi:hypothetical protein
MTSQQIKMFPIPEPKVLGLGPQQLGLLALEYQFTKCQLLREIAAQLAYANELKLLDSERDPR